ncbi:hypothetical protein BACOVA_04499 [Bacteroides ovatus ATCC 8483]|uniref:Uncharacterized protein n=1 Tax=Bacteroides ovatus (strain ATCC 8483 / DSM 1896 / JCM 5824 / BCRC 10623 / CCUG 4943 / NCTC 11153) TaxID=411476 RepID=A0AAN3A5B6_BACO1|nr:hypothetical protein BACOVA_04499 [Bacteroides ovatus ATCC 8483]
MFFLSKYVIIICLYHKFRHGLGGLHGFLNDGYQIATV